MKVIDVSVRPVRLPAQVVISTVECWLWLYGWRRRLVNASNECAPCAPAEPAGCGWGRGPEDGLQNGLLVSAGDQCAVQRVTSGNDAP